MDSLKYILPVFGKLLYTYPDTCFLDKIKSAGLLGDILYDSDSEAFKEGSRLLSEWQLSTDNFDEDIADYQDLFVGVRGRVKTPPWESVYVAPEPVMFGQCTLNARLWYDKYGLEIKNIRHEPDDHMGIELIFYAHLLNQEPVQADSFFREHILLWYERFFKAVAAQSSSKLYKGLALTLYAICTDVERSISVKA